MKGKKNKNQNQNDENDHQISRKEALTKIGSFAAFSVSTMMVLLPGNAHAEGSPAPSSPSSAPSLPKKHGLN